MAEQLLRTEHLCRHYQRGKHVVHALDDMSIHINSGEYVSILGKSGSGKSTLLNLLAGLDSATSGSFFVAGRDISSFHRSELASYRAHSVGMVFQSFHLIQHRSALQNVELSLYFSPLARNERRQKAITILEQLGMGDRLDHRPADMSGGEQQRVAIARALVKEPRILFADEPTGNLDQENTNQIAELLASLRREGLTIVMVSHDQELAAALSDRIYYLQYGKLEREDILRGENR